MKSQSILLALSVLLFSISAQNILFNGGFEQNSCQYVWCIFKAENQKGVPVPGWIAQPQIQVGDGSYFNPSYTGGRVASLDGDINYCIRQYFPSKIKSGTLKFTWAANIYASFASNGIIAKINGEIVKIVVPCDYEIHHETIPFSIIHDSVHSWVQFCGVGISDQYGSIIDNIELVY